MFRPINILIHKRKLPHFSEDFPGNRVFMIAQLPGWQESWEGYRRTKARLGNTHPWNRYFNKPLKTKPETLADIEEFLLNCTYVSDQKTRRRVDYWEPPDIFEERKTGDCEDHAIWAWRQLHELGFKARLAIGEWGGGHAWVHIYVNGRVYLLETTQKNRWFPDTTSYNPKWSVENLGNEKFAYFLHSTTKIYDEMVQVNNRGSMPG